MTEIRATPFNASVAQNIMHNIPKEFTKYLQIDPADFITEFVTRSTAGPESTPWVM